MARLVMLVCGILFLLLGILFALLPMLPFGLPFLILSVVFLVPVSPRLAAVIRGLRRRSPWLDHNMARIATRLPTPYKRIFSMTEHGNI